MSLPSIVSLSDVDRDLLKKIIILLEASLRNGSLAKYSEIEPAVVTTS